MLSAVRLLSAVCLSVCLSVTLVHPTQAVELFGNFFSPYKVWARKSYMGQVTLIRPLQGWFVTIF